MYVMYVLYVCEAVFALNSSLFEFEQTERGPVVQFMVVFLFNVSAKLLNFLPVYSFKIYRPTIGGQH